MNNKQRRWYFSHTNGNPKGISESFFKDSVHTVRPTSGIKRTPQYIKKLKMEKVTDTVGANFGLLHISRSVEKTFETKN